MSGFKKFEEQIEKDVPKTVNFLKSLFGLSQGEPVKIAPQTIEAKPVLKEYEVKQLETSNYKCKICEDKKQVITRCKTLNGDVITKQITCPYCRGIK